MHRVPEDGKRDGQTLDASERRNNSRRYTNSEKIRALRIWPKKRKN